MMTYSRCSEDMQRSIDYKNEPGRAGTEYREVCVTQARHMEEKWAKHSSGQSTCPRKPLIYPYVYMNHDLELLLKQHADSLVLCCQDRSTNTPFLLRRQVKRVLSQQNAYKKIKFTQRAYCEGVADNTSYNRCGSEGTQNKNWNRMSCPVAWLHLARDCWYGWNSLQAEVIRLSWPAIWIRHFNDLKELERHKFVDQIIFWLIISCVCRESQCVQDLMPSQM